MMSNVEFEKRKSIEQVEESTELAPKFDENGLIPVVTTSSFKWLYQVMGSVPKSLSPLTAIVSFGFLVQRIPMRSSASKLSTIKPL